MNKLEFLMDLENKLQALPEEERTQSLEYYAEIIDDHIDDGMCEEEAVAACGSTDQIADQIITDTPLVKLVKQKIKPKRQMQAWEIVLLIVGSPVWFSLLVAGFCVLLALSISFWAIVICLFAVAFACGVSAVALPAAAIIMLVQGQLYPALFCFGCALILAGVAILFFLFGKWAGKGVAALHRVTFRGIKRCFVRKEATK